MYLTKSITKMYYDKWLTYKYAKFFNIYNNNVWLLLECIIYAHLHLKLLSINIIWKPIQAIKEDIN